MNGALSICVLILYCCYLCPGIAGSDINPDLLVETTNGMVLGKYSDVGNARVFKSIPYGGSVSGQYRWTDPRPHADWTDVWDATLDNTDRPSACPQSCTHDESIFCAPKEIQTEDCLFLNVFTPHSANQYSNLPVLVFIHGGSYMFGYSSDPLYDGSYLASDSDIIVVTMNYRLGALGFLAFGSGVNGNFGIKDQRLALKWVQDNVASFGGNPNQVTLSGESAGAMSVAIHMTSEKSKGLFHQAIVQSDPFGINYRTTKQGEKNGLKLAKRLSCCNWLGYNCKLNCLRGKSVEKILNDKDSIWAKILNILKYYIQHKFLRFLNIPAKDIWEEFLTWAPVIDGDQLTDQSLELFKKGQFNGVPTIMGTTTAEGILLVYRKIPFKVPNLVYPLTLSLLFGKYKVLKKLYPPAKSDQRPQLSVIFKDYAFYCPTVQSAKRVASSVPVYSYIFDHPFTGYPGQPKLCKTKSCHGAELPYVFHTYENPVYTDDEKVFADTISTDDEKVFADTISTDDEKVFADTISRYWGNFVNTGNPNTPRGFYAAFGQWYAEPQSLILPEWPRYTSANKWASLSLDVNNFQAESEPRKKFCDVLDGVDYIYGTDLIESLSQAGDMAAYLELEE